MRVKRARGFTFLELIIALTIFTVIASSLYLSLNTGIRVWKKGDAVIGHNQRLRVAFGLLSEDLRNAVLFFAENQEPGDRNEMMRALWEGERISFLTSTAVYYEDGIINEIIKVTYLFNRDKHTFEKGIQSLRNGFKEDNVEYRVLLSDVSNVAFKYCYETSGDEGYEWKDIWESGDELPQGIRVEITTSPAETEPISYTGEIFIPAGSPGKEE